MAQNVGDANTSPGSKANPVSMYKAHINKNGKNNAIKLFASLMPASFLLIDGGGETALGFMMRFVLMMVMNVRSVVTDGLDGLGHGVVIFVDTYDQCFTTMELKIELSSGTAPVVCDVLQQFPGLSCGDCYHLKVDLPGYEGMFHTWIQFGDKIKK
jgi:hypothetical protein